MTSKLLDQSRTRSSDFRPLSTALIDLLAQTIVQQSHKSNTASLDTVAIQRLGNLERSRLCGRVRLEALKRCRGGHHGADKNQTVEDLAGIPWRGASPGPREASPVCPKSDLKWLSGPPGRLFHISLYSRMMMEWK